MAVKRKRRRSSAVVLLNGLLTLLIIGIIAAGAVFYYGVTQFFAAGPKAEETAFLVPDGASLRSVAAPLEEQGFISNALLFQAAGRISGNAAKLKPGQFMVPAHASMSDIIDLITKGEPQVFLLDVIPGETSWAVAQKLNDPAASLTGEALPAPPPEGSLLAVRYDWTLPTQTRDGLVAKMQARMEQAVAEIWAGRDPAVDEVIKSPDELVILASLVEKETGVGSERPQVASVFINRLKRHMRLQTDPSVIYGITLGQGKLERPLTTKDLAAKTDYNTYQLDGLPKGPIANPGVAALEAVAHPAQTNYLYFVAKSSNPADGHVFAASYAEHRKNVALYRKAVAEDGAEAAKEALEAEQAKDAGDTSE
jgi:UPF0755 protein